MDGGLRKEAAGILQHTADSTDATSGGGKKAEGRCNTILSYAPQLISSR